jgi:ElaB/YqjD/DUF883 family membrane-anchored ribosome-binding protein
MSSQIQDSIKSTSAKVANSLDGFSHEMGKSLGDFASQVSETSSEYVDQSRRYLRSNPFMGVAVAAGAGMAVGYLVALATRK